MVRLQRTSVNINELEQTLNERLATLGGSAAILDDRFIVLSCNGLQGLVAPTPDGKYFIKVSTLWKDCDEDWVELPERVSVKVIELFTGFWVRRGVGCWPSTPTA